MSDQPAFRWRRSDLALAALLLTLLVGGYFAAQYFTAHGEQNLPLSSCDLNRQDCLLELPGGGSLSLAMTPKPAPTLQPISLHVAITGRSVQSVAVDLGGAEMEMGHNRPQLTALGNGRFTGQATLPVCVTGRMLWQATLLLDTGHGVIAAPFRFTTGGR